MTRRTSTSARQTVLQAFLRGFGYRGGTRVMDVLLGVLRGR